MVVGRLPEVAPVADPRYYESYVYPWFSKSEPSPIWVKAKWLTNFPFCLLTAAKPSPPVPGALLGLGGVGNWGCRLPGARELSPASTSCFDFPSFLIVTPGGVTQWCRGPSSVIFNTTRKLQPLLQVGPFHTEE